MSSSGAGARTLIRTLTTSRSSHSSPRRSEEHTSELQSPDHLVCRLLLEKKKNKNDKPAATHHAQSKHPRPVLIRHPSRSPSTSRLHVPPHPVRTPMTTQTPRRHRDRQAG